MNTMTPTPATLWTLAAATLGVSLHAAEGSTDARNNWPQWRGPLATGVAPDANPPLTWSEESHVKWKFKIPGFGTSTPIVWGDQVFVMTAVPTGQKTEPAPTPPPVAAPEPAAQGTAAAPTGEASPPRRGGGGGRGGMPKPTEVYQFNVIAVDRQTGAAKWQQTARETVPHEGHHRDHGFASFSPVTDGEHLFAYFGSRGLHAYDLAGNKKWEKDFGELRTRAGFGEGGSLALHGNTLVVNWDHEGEDFVVALDKRDGKELWRKTRDEPTSWSTPLVIMHQGKPQVVVSAAKRVRSYDLASGEMLWEASGMTENVIPTPVTGDGMVYAISGFRGAALLAIRLGHTGDLTGTDAIAWSHNKNTPYVPSPLLYNQRLYFFSGNTGMLSCFDAANGKVVIDAERVAGLPGVYASPVGAAGRVYLVGREGQTVVLKQSDTYEVLASNKLDDKFDASAALVGKELFLRGHQFLYCLAE
ncbi:MAG: outer membrane protein assembly factor BamB family protein [Limisphaerales bacterium]